MSKLQQCQYCQSFSGYLGVEFLVCAIHPSGPVVNPCPDFCEAIGQWEPLGASYSNDELVLQPEYYLSSEERREVFSKHPLFTGFCPNCGAAFSQKPAVHWDCPSPECDWVDDSVV
jgi:hypothetical protein